MPIRSRQDRFVRRERMPIRSIDSDPGSAKTVVLHAGRCLSAMSFEDEAIDSRALRFRDFEVPDTKNPRLKRARPFYRIDGMGRIEG